MLLDGSYARLAGRKMPILIPAQVCDLTSGEQIQDVNIYLDFDNREPTNTDGTPLPNAIGYLHHEVGTVGGGSALKPHDFSEVWEQVRQGGYVDCIIEITIRPVEFLGEDTGWEWDVIHNQGIYITDASVRFCTHVS